MKNASLILILIFLFGASVFAQENNSKKGKPETKKWKTELDKAKKGNTKSLLFVVGLYRGDMLAPDETKDYSKALKWLDKFPDSEGETETQKLRDLFLIKATGGFGAKQKQEDAKEYLTKYCDLKQEKAIYQDKSDLNLCDLFDIQADSPENRLLLGRYYLEFGLSYDIGMYWLETSANEGNTDAKYLKSKWAFLKSMYKQDFDKDTLQTLSLDYAKQGSQIATMEHLLATNTSSKILSKNDTEKYLKASLNSDNQEVKLKAKLLFLPFRSGKEYIASLRQIANLQENIEQKDYELAKKALAELKTIDEKIANLEGLHAFAKEKEFESADFDLDAYQNSFGGNYKKLIELYHKISTAENTTFIGTENLGKYRKEIQEKITKIVENQSTVSELLASFDAISNSNNSSLFPNEIVNIYKEQINRKANQIIESTQAINTAFATYEQVSKNTQLVNTESLQKYADILSPKINTILNSFDAKQITYLSKAFEYYPKTQSVLANYQAIIAQKLIDTGAEASKIKFFEFEYDINYSNFETFAQGENLYNSISQNEIITAEQKMELNQKLRKKVVYTIYGDNPAKELILKTKNEFFAQMWLNGIGKPLIVSKLISYQEIEIEAAKFTSLPQGEKLHSKINSETAFSTTQKNNLLGKLRKKVVKDIYYKEPFEKQLITDKNQVIAASWLAPEGRILFLDYLLKYTEEQVNLQTFTSLNAAETVFHQMEENDYLPPSEKTKMLSIIRKKALNDLYQGVPSPQEFIDIKAILDSVIWLQPASYEIYSSYLARGLIANIETKTFPNLAEAHSFYDIFTNNTNLSQSDKDLIAGILTRKTVKDVYGENPSPAKIKEFMQDLGRNEWLNPEGQKVYFELMNDSRNSFTATLKSPDKSKNYYYKVEIEEGKTNKFKLEIKEIRSLTDIGLVYSTLIKVDKIGEDKYEVKIFLAQLKGGFKWVIFHQEYLKTTYPKELAGIETEATFKMKKYNTKNSFGYTEQELKVKDNTKFTEKEAMRAALKYFIFSYGKLL